MIRSTTPPAHTRRRPGLARLGLAAALLLATVLPGAAAEKLRLGNEGVYPPFSMVDSAGNLTGVEPDLAREMCTRLGAECEFVVMDFKALIPSLLQGKFDILVSQVTPTPERKEKMLLSTRVVANPMVFLVPADGEYVFTKEGLAGKGLKMGLQRGGAHIKIAEDMFGDSVEIVLYDNPDQFHLDMLAGRINSSFEAKINAQLEFLDKQGAGKFKMSTEEYWIGEASVPEAERGLSWVVRKDSPELLARMDAALKEIIADCTYTKIRKKYLAVATLPEDAACETTTN
ncbi:transporter substrate-binding domain-containing protein [Methylobrevis albus]|uniref:Transporter substrate-binding domain-containing protein n=1 Tax=Methylobrevis albus TaxID=2793297 RepID=A0A931I324_9HYPH|nr:transporter substrate-binding domain-containing protein [Methylobrevis albus]MBH0237973.1 transporter substrate-binding domain-containing protein [Methylobrevis albus]